MGVPILISSSICDEELANLMFIFFFKTTSINLHMRRNVCALGCFCAIRSLSWLAAVSSSCASFSHFSLYVCFTFYWVSLIWRRASSGEHDLLWKNFFPLCEPLLGVVFAAVLYKFDPVFLITHSFWYRFCNI